MACCRSDYLGAKLNSILLRVEAYLEDCGRGPCRSVIDFGASVPYDDCCACLNGEGQLWIGVISFDSVAPAQGAPAVCGSTWDVSLVVGLTRCALTLDGNGNPPSDTAVSLQALSFLQDRALIVGALKSLTADDTFDPHDWQWGQGIVNNAGGCLSFEQSITLSLTDCCDS